MTSQDWTLRPKPGVVCPRCGGRAPSTETRYGTRHACCGLHSWHGKPLVDQETHAARQAAHKAFDALWKEPTRVMRRKDAYKALSKRLGIPREDCHMALMPRELAERVPAAVAEIRKEVEP